jgi:hypothetical protein
VDAPDRSLIADSSTTAVKVRDAWRHIGEFVAPLPSRTSPPTEIERLAPQPHKTFTYHQAVGLQMLQRRHAALAKLTLKVDNG